MTVGGTCSDEATASMHFRVRAESSGSNRAAPRRPSRASAEPDDDAMGGSGERSAVAAETLKDFSRTSSCRSSCGAAPLRSASAPGIRQYKTHCSRVCIFRCSVRHPSAQRLLPAFGSTNPLFSCLYLSLLCAAPFRSASAHAQRGQGPFLHFSQATERSSNRPAQPIIAASGGRVAPPSPHAVRASAQ